MNDSRRGDASYSITKGPDCGACGGSGVFTWYYPGGITKSRGEPEPCRYCQGRGELPLNSLEAPA